MPSTRYFFVCSLLISIVLFFFSCGNKNKANSARAAEIFKPRDSTLCKIKNDDIVNFATKYALKDSVPGILDAFYRQRSYTAAWTNNSGVNEYAGNFVNLLNNEIRLNGDSVGRNIRVLESLYSSLVTDQRFSCGDSLFTDLEIMLTLNFFDYAKRNWGGMSDDLSKRAGWFIVRKQMDYEQLLNGFLSSSEKSNPKEPVYRQYGLLKSFLGKYAEYEKQGRWISLPERGLRPVKTGDTAFFIGTLKKILHLTDDFAGDDTDNYFDEHLSTALQNFQERHGIEVTGTFDKNTAVALRVPLHERVQQIMINMERSKWVPPEVQGDYVVVNIPEFKMHVYRDNDLEWSSNVIVGKSNPLNKTVIFNDSLEMIVFSPYWNIPPNILRKETLPEIKKNRKYLKKANLEVVDRKGNPVDPGKIDWDKYTDHFPYIIRELPGKSNSLGLVKFLFPNSYDIYMHDTPAKTLFTKSSRSFSHGCIRLEEPARFAQYLLRDDPSWTPEKIEEYMNGGKETFVRLRKKVPVFIAYFTSWVDREGRLHFADDIYGHDENMRKLLFTGSDTTAKMVQEPVE